MNKQQAQQIIRDTFESPFEKGKFINFIKNLLNRIDNASFTYMGNYIPDAYKQHIKKFERIGKFSDGENRIDILIVILHKETSLEHARTMQRNFIAGYLRGKYGSTKEKDAALVAFVSPDKADWRFSLVKMDVLFELGKDKPPKPVDEFTPARRWSFLVGENEKSHTAQSNLVKILADDEHDPTLVKLEQAFDIETVTKEFFIKYRKLFLCTKEELDKIVKIDPKVKADFKKNCVDTVNFAKKLLGQIVFLYFLQKKGWFGVKREAYWGDGSKHFLRELFEGKHGPYKNFFNEILEPLFYDALSRDRSDIDHWNDQFKCKIPFLNGGLFDPIGNYSWYSTDVLLSNELFSNTNKTKEGDTGDGILDIFDRYNFTVKEDEPLEKEVAIDPELLGKTYEKFNAIRPDNYDEFKNVLKSGKTGEENKFNKKFGVYYTPREIVHYMCQQSLIEYLAIELDRKVRKEDIETLIHIGERVSENEARVKQEGRETKAYSYKLPVSIRKNAGLIDKKLEDMTVCDPAVGSGAFPVGMMNEIVRARNVLSIFIHRNNRTPYKFKSHCIEHTLYGVDIDPGAVEIAKLRLWLSLVVDEENIKNIKPLPNLDYRIVKGNSLIGFPENWDSQISKEIEELKYIFLNETNQTKKIKLKEKIDEKLNYRYENSLKIIGYKVDFDFKMVFSEVFYERHGFDVVIANPPYVQIQKLSVDEKSHLERQGYKTFAKTSDLYCLFYERGIAVLRACGILTFISSNKFLRAGYGTALRRFLAEQNKLLEIIDFGELPVFEAGTDPCILLVQKCRPHSEKIKVANVKDVSGIHNVRLTRDKVGFELDRSSLKPNGWTLEHPSVMDLLDKIHSIGKSLGKYVNGKLYYGIKTGLNEAFVIDRVTRDRIIAEDSKSFELIKSWLRGKDIRRWYADYRDLFMININSSANVHWPWSGLKTEQAEVIFEREYPAIYSHLRPYKTKLISRDDQGRYYWELRSCVYYEKFERPKIVFNETSKELHALFDEDKLHISKTGFIILSENAKYILGIMNSRLMDYLYRYEFPSWGDPWKGGRIQFRGERMEAIPIATATTKQQSDIELWVKKILTLKKTDHDADVSTLEAEIDELVYQLYDLNPEEIKVVEEKYENAN